MMVFVLTGATAIFAPVQFMAGVYGMNFSIDGTPTIPELNWQYGYYYFWTLVVTYLTVSTSLAVWLHKRFQAKQRAEAEQPTDTGNVSRASRPWMSRIMQLQQGRGSAASSLAVEAAGSPTVSPTVCGASDGSCGSASPVLPQLPSSVAGGAGCSNGIGTGVSSTMRRWELGHQDGFQVLRVPLLSESQPRNSSATSPFV